MKKSIKRALSLILCVAMAATVMVGMTVTASAESKVVIANSCDDDYDWTNQNQGEMSIDTTEYMQGTGCIFLDMPATDEGLITSFPFASMMVVNFDPVDTNEMPHFEMFRWQSETTPSSGIQINFCDPDIGSDDGFNTNNAIDNAAPGWYRMQIDMSKLGPAINASDRANIGHLRISWLSYKDQGTYYECDWKYDGIIFYNDEFLAERTAEETKVTGMITALQTPTAENVATVEADIIAAHDLLAADKAEYPNFYVENYAKLDRVWKEYMNLKKSDYEKAANDAIATIGEVKADNYTDKLDAIKAAEAKVDELIKTFGEGNFTVDMTTLTAARAAYDDFAAAAPVTEAIKALPAVEALTVENEAAVTAARTAYDKLNEAQKAIVGTDNEAILVAAEEQMYKLLHPYTLGDINEDGDVTAADALLALQHAVGKITLEGNPLLAAEVDGKDGVTAADALLVLQKSVGKIDKFPVEEKA